MKRPINLKKSRKQYTKDPEKKEKYIHKSGKNMEGIRRNPPKVAFSKRTMSTNKFSEVGETLNQPGP